MRPRPRVTPLPSELPPDARSRNYQTTYDPQLDASHRSKEMHRRYEADARAATSDPRGTPAAARSAPSPGKPRPTKRKVRHHLERIVYEYDAHSVGPPPRRELVLSGLSPLTTPGAILQQVRAFGRVEASELKVDPRTGQSIGIFWLRYAHDEDQSAPGGRAQDGAKVAAQAKQALEGRRIGTDTVHASLDRDRAKYVKLYREELGKRYPPRRRSSGPPPRPSPPARASPLHGASTYRPRSRWPHDADEGDETPHRATTSREVYYGGSWRRPPLARDARGAPPPAADAPRRPDARAATSLILQQLRALGRPYVFVPMPPTSRVDARAIEEHFRGFFPALVERDESGWYVGFRSADAAVRCKRILDTATLYGYHLRLEVREPPQRERAERPAAAAPPEAAAPPAPAKTAWTPSELLQEASAMLAAELLAVFKRDIKNRVVAPQVTQFLRPEGAGGAKLTQRREEQAKAAAAAPAPRISGDQQLPSFRKKEDMLAVPKRETPEPARVKKDRHAAIDYSDESEEEREAPTVPKPEPSPEEEEAAAAARLPTPDLSALRIAEDDEELYLLQQALRRDAEGQPPIPPMEEEAQEDDLRHERGAARAQGFYRIPPERKAVHLPDRNRAVVDAGGTGFSALASARNNRADSRRLVHGIEQHKRETLTDTDILKFNQLRSRKKQLKFAKSAIHDWGLYAAEMIPAGDMIIEYVGEIVRQQVADHREKLYERAGNFSTYLFRVDDDVVVDATQKGNIARLMNHCCTPNCNAKILTVNGEKRIVLYAKQMILPGQELTYDYKFQAAEGDEDAIPCLCGSPQCRRFL